MSDDFDRGAMAMLRWLYSTSGRDFAAGLFPHSSPRYQTEKAVKFATNPAKTILLLDATNRLRLLEFVKLKDQMENYHE